MTDGVDTGEESEEEPAGLVVRDVLVQREDTVDPGPPEESDHLATHEEEQAGETEVDPLARGSGQDQQVVPASATAGAGV